LRWRLHLVKHRSTLKNRVHSTLIAFGYQVPMADLFGHGGRRLLRGLELPEPWRGHVDASVELIDELELRISAIEHELQRSGADHKYVPILMTAPGSGGSPASRSRASSVTSTGSRRRPSSLATPACARASASPATSTCADRCPSADPGICAGG
jgi:hypothetical protein